MTHLADWAIWVTLLLGLERGSRALGADASRQILLRRFDDGKSAPGVRVYAARIAELVEHEIRVKQSYAVALRGDSRVALDFSGEPIGYSILSGATGPAESIAVGKIALLVVGPTYTSGPNHLDRMDLAAASVGLDRIHPLGPSTPELAWRPIDMKAASLLFTVQPVGADMSLMARALQSMP